MTSFQELNSRLYRQTERKVARVCQGGQQLDRGIRTGYLSGSRGDGCRYAKLLVEKHKKSWRLCLFYTAESTARVETEGKVKGGQRHYISFFQGSQAVPALPSERG
jgi:hypothetical protein